MAENVDEETVVSSSGENLFPEIEVPDIEEDAVQYDQDYKPSVAWDFEKGDFVMDGTGNMVECDGKEAFKVWCVKTTFTVRNACLAYPSSIGTEIEEALKDDDTDIAESSIEKTITEALEVNPRTEYVRGFVFDWDGDSVHVSFHVKGVELDEFSIGVDISNEREE